MASGLIALGLALAALGAVQFARGAFGPAPAHERVARPSSAEERAAGVVRGFATLRETGPKPLPPCLITHKKGKKTRTIHVNGDVAVTMKGGESLRIPDRATVEFFHDEFPFGAGIGQDVYDRVHARYPELRGSGSWKIGCVGPAEPIWLEGCADAAGELTGCDGPHVLLTPSGPRRRAAWEIAGVVRWAALSLLGLLAALRVLAFITSYPREVVVALATPEGSSPPSATTRYGFAVFLTIALPISLGIGTETELGAWLTVAILFAFAILFLVGLGSRLGVLGRALRRLVSTETSRLHDRAGQGHEGGAGELAVRIAADAPTLEGFREGARHAFVRCSIQESYERSSGDKTVLGTRAIGGAAAPRYVPIEDESGRGLLDTRGCALEVLEEPATWLLSTPAWLEGALGKPLTPGPDHRAFNVTWKALDPGEPLLLFGAVERASPGDAGAVIEMAEGYRQPSTVPIVRSSGEEQLIAYVGDERLLVSHLRRERAVAAALLVIVPIVAGAFALALWSLGMG